jgi:hypothetical protein
VKKFLIIAAVVVIILAGVAVVVMYNIGDRLIEEAIAGDMLTSEPVQEPTGNTSSAGADVFDEKQVTPTPSPMSSNTEGNASTSVTPEPAAKTSNSSNPNTQVKPAEAKKEITTDKIAEIKAEVAPTDKISAAALVLKRLSAGDVNELKNLMADGLTAEEKEKAKQIAYSRFTEQEINEIKAMYSKYMK